MDADGTELRLASTQAGLYSIPAEAPEALDEDASPGGHECEGAAEPATGRAYTRGGGH